MLHGITFNKFFILVILLLILSTFYFWKKSISYENKLHTLSKVTNNCLTGLDITQQLINNCSNAYLIMTSCVSNLNICNVNSAKERLQMLNSEKQKLQYQLNILTEEIGSLTSTSKS